MKHLNIKILLLAIFISFLPISNIQTLSKSDIAFKSVTGIISLLSVCAIIKVWYKDKKVINNIINSAILGTCSLIFGYNAKYGLNNNYLLQNGKKNLFNLTCLSCAFASLWGIKMSLFNTKLDDSGDLPKNIEIPTRMFAFSVFSSLFFLSLRYMYKGQNFAGNNLFSQKFYYLLNQISSNKVFEKIKAKIPTGYILSATLLILPFIFYNALKKLLKKKKDSGLSDKQIIAAKLITFIGLGISYFAAYKFIFQETLDFFVKQRIKELRKLKLEKIKLKKVAAIKAAT